MADQIELILADARAARRSGRASEALASYRHAADLARAADAQVLLCHALRHVSDLAREQGAGALALEAGAEAVALARMGHGEQVELANALRVQALAADATEGAVAAAPLWREARSLYREEQIEDGVRECDQHLDHGQKEH